MIAETITDYDIYLKSDHWKRMRKRALWNDDYKCHDCGTAQVLQIHHENYHRVGRELLEDLVTLCSYCHVERHPEVKEIVNVL